MGLFDQFPYTNFHELNLDWLIKLIKELENTVNNFVALNTIKYADPIQWNITTQYEANTVVVDPQTGTAYISSKAVPAGVALTNTDYWSVIFTLDIISANKNLTLRDDGSNVLATFASNADDWLLWNGTLYKVSQAININEAYVEGYNLTRYTVELFIADYIQAINDAIGDLDDLTTSDKSSIVSAVNELVTTIGNLADLTTTDTSSIVSAVNELVTTIGDLADLTTSDKSSIVSAINELVSSIGSVTASMAYYFVEDYKTDNNDYVDAIHAALADMSMGGTLVMPKECVISTNKTIDIDPFVFCSNGNQPLIFDFNGTYISYTGTNWAIKIRSNGWNRNDVSAGWKLNAKVILKNLVLEGTSDGIGGIRVENGLYHKIENVRLGMFTNGCGFQLYTGYFNGAMPWSENVVFEDCYVHRCLYGYQSMQDTTGSYEGVDPSQSGSGTSINGCHWVRCLFNNNYALMQNIVSRGFDIHGNASRCTFDSCGGWLGYTNGSVMFYLDGWFDGATLISPFLDGARDYSNFIALGSGYNTSISTHFATIVGASYGFSRIGEDLLPYFFLVGYSHTPSHQNGRIINNNGTAIPLQMSLHPDYDGFTHLRGNLAFNVTANTTSKQTVSNSAAAIGNAFKSIAYIHATPIIESITDANFALLENFKFAIANVSIIENDSWSFDILVYSDVAVRCDICYDIAFINADV